MQSIKPQEVRVSKALADISQTIAAGLREAAGEDYGFVLIAVPFDREGEYKSSFCSNCKRELVIPMLRHMAEQLVAKGDEPPVAVHEYN